jgi:LTXXQ motif family protein
LSQKATEVFVKAMLIAVAIAAGSAIAVPAYAQNATPATQEAQPAPAVAPEQAGGGEQGGGGGEGGGGEHWGHGRGQWGMRGWPMMRHRMWGRESMRWDPQQRCVDRLAWRAARRAYVETELNLTADQRPLWDKLQGIAQGEQQKERQLCQSPKTGEETTMLDRMDRAQQFLSARLDALQSAKPAVQALYQSLTPEQKAIFDHPFRP